MENQIIESDNNALPCNTGQNEENKIQQVDSCIKSTTDMLDAASGTIQSVDGCINSINDCINSLNQVAETCFAGVASWKEIDKQMMAMDIQFQQFSKELDNDLAKYEKKIPLIEKQLDSYNQSLSKILDYVISLDPKSDQEFEMKMKFMDKIDSMLNSITNAMIQLM